MAFSTSTTGITASASARETRYSVRVTGWKEKAAFRPGIKITAAVTRKEKARVPHSHGFYFLRLNRDRIRERRLKEWKISIMLRVRKAMVMPTGDSATAHPPVSNRCPMK